MTNNAYNGPFPLIDPNNQLYLSLSLSLSPSLFHISHLTLVHFSRISARPLPSTRSRSCHPSIFQANYTYVYMYGGGNGDSCYTRAYRFRQFHIHVEAPA